MGIKGGGHARGEGTERGEERTGEGDGGGCVRRRKGVGGMYAGGGGGGGVYASQGIFNHFILFPKSKVRST